VLNQGESVDDWVYPPAVFICGNVPLSKWVDNEGVANWWNEINPAPLWTLLNMVSYFGHFFEFE